MARTAKMMTAMATLPKRYLSVSSGNSSNWSLPWYLRSRCNICFPFFNTSVVTVVTPVADNHSVFAVEFLTVGTTVKVWRVEDHTWHDSPPLPRSPARVWLSYELVWLWSVCYAAYEVDSWSLCISVSLRRLLSCQIKLFLTWLLSLKTIKKEWLMRRCSGIQNPPQIRAWI